MSKKKNRFIAKHAKSSAAFVSLGIHAALTLIALSYVAVTVIKQEDQAFEVKPDKRPQMQLKKLQVPANIEKKKTPKPQLHQNVPDIKMPELTGVKGGIGSDAGDGLGGAGGLGFSMPGINSFKKTDALARGDF